jgi:hypothetical protein
VIGQLRIVSVMIVSVSFSLAYAGRGVRLPIRCVVVRW